MFPGIADPGADRVLLFAGIAPIAAVPSNGTQVLVRVFYGRKRENYGVDYREAQQPITMEVPETFDARTRAYLLVQQHDQEICKRTKPKCEVCPVGVYSMHGANRKVIPDPPHSRTQEAAVRFSGCLDL